MAYNFYTNYLLMMQKDPKEAMEEECQESINYAWENNATVYNILAQCEIGSNNFECESVMVNSVINSTTGETLSDDYRKIIHKHYKCARNYLGKMYKFFGETWLTINTNTKIGSTKNSILQRCNNILRWQDENSFIQEIECIYSRNLSGTNFDYGSEGVPEIGADAKLLVQRNEITNKINFNQRFLLDGHAFQIKQIDNHYSQTLMTLYIFEVPLQANDDLENGIAGGADILFNPDVMEDVISPSTIKKILLGYSQEYSVYNYTNGEITDDVFEICASNANEDCYDLTIIDGNNFIVSNLKESNKLLKITCTNTATHGEVTIDIVLGGKW